MQPNPSDPKYKTGDILEAYAGYLVRVVKPGVFCTVMMAMDSGKEIKLAVELIDTPGDQWVMYGYMIKQKLVLSDIEKIVYSIDL